MNSQKSSLEFPHFPVMLSEVIKISSPSKGGLFIDCTFGGGGYSKALLKFPKTKVIGLDRDNTVIIAAEKLKKKFQNRFQFYQQRFSLIDSVIEKNVDTIIFDLGLSSIQLNNLTRGFSFKSSEKLDMSMGLTSISAQDAINKLSQENLKLILRILGEEKEASIIARNIVKARSEKKISRVDELVEIITKSKKKNYYTKINPCTKSFQALRIFVNKEVTELVNGLINAAKLLKPGGKILIVSFHSIEDKIVKFFFSNFSENRSRPSRYLPENTLSDQAIFEDYNNKIIKPSKKELKQNNSSRSAKLRFAVRNKNEFMYPENFIRKFNKYLEIEAINV